MFQNPFKMSYCFILGCMTVVENRRYGRAGAAHLFQLFNVLNYPSGACVHYAGNNRDSPLHLIQRDLNGAVSFFLRQLHGLSIGPRDQKSVQASVDTVFD